MNTGPLDDTELGVLYRACERHSPYMYTLVRRLHTDGVIADPVPIGEVDARYGELEAALEPFRHVRVRNDGPNEYAFSDLIDGTMCVVAYVRNEELADRFNQAFERVRLALKEKP